MLARYLIVDYERANFSISRTIWPEDSGEPVPPAARIVAIAPLNDTSEKAFNFTGNAMSTPHHNQKLSSGVISGIAISVAFLCIIAASAIFFVMKKRRYRKLSKTERLKSDPFRKAELDGHGRILEELDSLDRGLPEVDGLAKMEMQGSDVYWSAFNGQRVEAEGGNMNAELERDTIVAAAHVYAIRRKKVPHRFQ